MLFPARSHFVKPNSLLTFTSTRKGVIAILSEEQGFKGKDSEGKTFASNKALSEVLIEDDAISNRELLKRSLQHAFLGRPTPTYHAKTNCLKEKQPTFSDLYGIPAPSHGKLLGMKDTHRTYTNTGQYRSPTKVVLMCYHKVYILTTTGYLTVPGALAKIIDELTLEEAINETTTKEGYAHNYASHTTTDFKPHAIVFSKPSHAMSMFSKATKGFTTEYAAGAGILSTKENPTTLTLTTAP